MAPASLGGGRAAGLVGEERPDDDPERGAVVGPGRQGVGPGEERPQRLEVLATDDAAALALDQLLAGFAEAGQRRVQRPGDLLVGEPFGILWRAGVDQQLDGVGFIGRGLP